MTTLKSTTIALSAIAVILPQIINGAAAQTRISSDRFKADIAAKPVETRKLRVRTTEADAQRSKLESAYERILELQADAEELATAGRVSEKHARLISDLDDLAADFADVLEDLEAEDKLGNFEIQDLMSRYNQAESLASSVQKKKDDTSSAVIGKVG